MQKITYEQYEQIQGEMVIEFLKTATSKERHQLVLGWNWDSSLNVLKWIISDPDTDKATALYIYWANGPRWHKQYVNREEAMAESPWNISNFDLAEETEKLFLSGFYKNHQFAFDPTSDRGHNWTTEYLDKKIKTEIPDIMFKGLGGADVQYNEMDENEDWEEGIPPHINKKMREFELI